MSSVFTLMVLCGVAVMPQEKGQSRSATDIQRAIEQLSDSRFVVRQQATEFLWGCGSAAAPALTEALNSPDREVVYRAREVLEKFRFGIFPDTPPDVLALIEEYRGGNIAGRRKVLSDLLDKRRIATALTLLETELDDAMRIQLTQWVMQDVERVAPSLLLEGDVDAVERLLMLAAETPEGMSQYVVFLLFHGKIEGRIDELRAAIRTAPTLGDVQLLAALLRAKGDLPGALQVADAYGQSPGLTESLLHETGAWGRLAEVQRRKLAENRQFAREIEFLGYAAAYNRLAGNDAALDELQQSIERLVTVDPEMVLQCAKALLINDRHESAIRMLEHHAPAVAFDLLCHQMRFGEAFKLVGIADPHGDLTPWFDDTIRRMGDPGDNESDRFGLGVEVCKTLHRLGLEETARRHLEQLGEAIRDEADPRRERLLSLAYEASRLGLTDTAYRYAGLAIDDGRTSIYVLQRLFPDQIATAQLWWNYMRDKHPEEERTLTLARLRALLDPPGDRDLEAAEMQRWVTEARHDIKDDDQLRANWSVVLAETCLIHGRRDMAQSILAEVAESAHTAARRLADLMAEDERWDEAARWYEQAWDLDRSQALDLHLFGLAAEKTGRADDGRSARAKADRLSVSSQQRRQIALGLDQRGYAAEARAQYEVIIRTSVYDQWYVTSAAQALGNLLADEDDLASAAYWERFLLSWLKTSGFLTEVEWYLQLPYLVHKSRALGLAKAGQFDEAVESMWLACANSPGDIQLAEDLVPILAAGGRQRDADLIFDKVYETNNRVCQAYPQSAMHHNNLAWLAARCDRRLDEALRLAQHAVGIEPDSATYLDTLAEVHFRRGNTDEAIRLARRCVEINPDGEHYQAQLKRFENRP